MKKPIFLLAAIAAAALVQPVLTRPAPAQPVRADADITIGMAVALSGPGAAIGTQARRGAEAAVAAINAEGGVLGRRLSLAVADDGCDPGRAVAVADALVSAGVGLVLGHLCSGPTIAAARVYAERGAVMMTASATSPTLTAGGRTTIFRACGRDDQQGAVAGTLLAERWRGQRIAVVHDRTVYGRGLAAQAVATMRALGVTPVMVAATSPGNYDFTALAGRLRQKAVAAVYFGGDHTALAVMVRQARAQGVEATFVGGETTATREFRAIAGPAGDGTLFTDAPPVKDRPTAARALAEVRATGAEPDNYSLHHYSAVQVLARAIAAAGSDRPADVARALRAGRFDTVAGSMAFDAKGDLKAPGWVVYQWRAGATEAARL